jgi:hypothetical protein
MAAGVGEPGGPGTQAARDLTADPGTGAARLAGVEARLRVMLEPYAGRLETATIYGLPTLRRPGAKAHDWFAFVKPAGRHVSLFLLPVRTWPDLLAGCSSELLSRKTGASTFTFRALPDELASEVEALLARACERYEAQG